MSRLSHDAIPASGPCDCRTIEPADRNGQPRTFVEVIDHEAMGYRAWGTPTGDFLAQQMERLAQLVRWSGATTPADHEARMEVWDREIQQQHFDRGHAEGLRQGRREGRDQGLAEAQLVIRRAYGLL